MTIQNVKVLAAIFCSSHLLHEQVCSMDGSALPPTLNNQPIFTTLWCIQYISNKRPTWGCPGWRPWLSKTGLSAPKPDRWPAYLALTLLLPCIVCNVFYFFLVFFCGFPDHRFYQLNRGELVPPSYLSIEESDWPTQGKIQTASEINVHNKYIQKTPIATLVSTKLFAPLNCIQVQKLETLTVNETWIHYGLLGLQTLGIHPLFPCLLKCRDSSSAGSIIQNMPTALLLSVRLRKRLCIYIFLLTHRLSCL